MVILDYGETKSNIYLCSSGITNSWISHIHTCFKFHIIQDSCTNYIYIARFYSYSNKLILFYWYILLVMMSIYFEVRAVKTEVRAEKIPCSSCFLFVINNWYTLHLVCSFVFCTPSLIASFISVKKIKVRFCHLLQKHLNCI